MVNVITFCYYTNERHWYETINIVLIPWLIKIPLVTFDYTVYFTPVTYILTLSQYYWFGLSVTTLKTKQSTWAMYLTVLLDDLFGCTSSFYSFAKASFIEQASPHNIGWSFFMWFKCFMYKIDSTIVLKIVNRFYFLFVHKCQFTGSVSDWF